MAKSLSNLVVARQTPGSRYRYSLWWDSSCKFFLSNFSRYTFQWLFFCLFSDGVAAHNASSNWRHRSYLWVGINETVRKGNFCWDQLICYRCYHCLEIVDVIVVYRFSPNCRYRLGRVDSIRASHPEASAWCHAMEKVKDNCKDKAAMSKEARSMFEVAMKKQTKVRAYKCQIGQVIHPASLKVMISNIMGNGLDIPLTGLREASK